VPKQARGFAVSSPRGQVVDLGTEFGVSVDDRGRTDVLVFSGELKASPLVNAQGSPSTLTLFKNQRARIDSAGVSRQAKDQTSAGRYIRQIVAPPEVVPRTWTLDFSKAEAGTLQDGSGRGVGLTHRLPGTGAALPPRDANLQLDTRRGVLALTTTRSDINQQVGLEAGEYLGFHLADLGFSGQEDFAVSATIPQIPGLEVVGQFGLYAGSQSDRNIRGGLIRQPLPNRYRQFLVNNLGGIDRDLNEVGLLSTGDDLRLTLRRIAGAYSLIVENLTAKSSTTLAIAQPTFLDGERDLYVGLFGANTQSDVRKTLTIKSISVTVWTTTAQSQSTRKGLFERKAISRS
jgi:hypothetical protein